MSSRCWLWDNGYAMSRDENDNDVLAGYMDGGEEQEAECRALRGDEPCLVHYFMPASWRHTDWCHTPTGHPGDCWEENNRVLGIPKIPAGQLPIEIKKA